MGRLLGYVVALGASAIAWRLGQPLGPLAATVAAALAAAFALHATRRFLRDHLDI